MHCRKINEVQARCLSRDAVTFDISEHLLSVASYVKYILDAMLVTAIKKQSSLKNLKNKRI